MRAADLEWILATLADLEGEIAAEVIVIEDADVETVDDVAALLRSIVGE